MLPTVTVNHYSNPDGQQNRIEILCFIVPFDGEIFCLEKSLGDEIFFFTYCVLCSVANYKKILTICLGFDN